MCEGIIEAATPYEALFMQNGLPADFLARLESARAGLEAVMGGRSEQVVAHVGARQGLKVQLLRGRRAVERLDALVRASFGLDEQTMAGWRAAKRVHRAPGGAGGSREEEVVVPEGPAEIAA